ncbi:hypothetical protein SAMN04488146_11839 [Bacillus nitratireducens]|nr:hypothetical protein SAMN04488146_11839 [Bacillus nitratireducens]
MGLGNHRTENSLSVNEISEMTGVPRSTIYAKNVIGNSIDTLKQLNHTSILWRHLNIQN